MKEVQIVNLAERKRERKAEKAHENLEESAK